MLLSNLETFKLGEISIGMILNNPVIGRNHVKLTKYLKIHLSGLQLNRIQSDVKFKITL